MKKLIALFIALLVTKVTMAQGGVEMADGLYRDGKIYVVVACLAFIVICLFAYMAFIDRRIKKVEKYFHNKN